MDFNQAKDRLLEYAYDELGSEEAGEIRRMLEQHAALREELAAINKALGAYRQLEKPVPPRSAIDAALKAGREKKIQAAPAVVKPVWFRNIAYSPIWRIAAVFIAGIAIYILLPEAQNRHDALVERAEETVFKGKDIPSTKKEESDREVKEDKKQRESLDAEVADDVPAVDADSAAENIRGRRLAPATSSAQTSRAVSGAVVAPEKASGGGKASGRDRAKSIDSESAVAKPVAANAASAPPPAPEPELSGQLIGESQVTGGIVGKDGELRQGKPAAKKANTDSRQIMKKREERKGDAGFASEKSAVASDLDEVDDGLAVRKNIIGDEQKPIKGNELDKAERPAVELEESADLLADKESGAKLSDSKSTATGNKQKFPTLKLAQDYYANGDFASALKIAAGLLAEKPGGAELLGILELKAYCEKSLNRLDDYRATVARISSISPDAAAKLAKKLSEVEAKASAVEAGAEAVNEAKE